MRTFTLVRSSGQFQIPRKHGALTWALCIDWYTKTPESICRSHHPLPHDPWNCNQNGGRMPHSLMTQFSVLQFPLYCLLPAES